MTSTDRQGRVAMLRTGVLRASVLRASVLRASVLRVGVLRVGVLRAGVLRAALAAAVAMMCAIGHAAAAIAPDDARETRWADEVVPQVVVGDPVWLATPHRSRVLALYARPSAPPIGAVIVVHGLGVHPDWSLIGDIRSGLADRGFATLSVQMPVLAADAPREQYTQLFPFAAERLDAALAWLHAQGHPRVAVLSHSMGASMVNAWMTSRPAIVAWVPIGMLVPFATAPRVPVLDVVGEHDYPEALRRVPDAKSLPADLCSRAITIPGADHFMQRAVPALLDAVKPWLTQALAAGCDERRRAYPNPRVPFLADLPNVPPP